MGKAKRGKCRLCEKESDLQHSHVGTPAFVYKRMLAADPTQKQFVSVDGYETRFSNDNRREHLLCGACEQRFGRWENYAARVSLQLDGRFPALERVRPCLDLPEICDASSLDCDALGRFATSIIWRRSISTVEDFSLGRDANRAIQDFLRSDYTLLPANTHVFCWLIRPSTTCFERGSYHTPLIELGESISAIFVTWGLQFGLHIGHPPSFAELDLLRRRRVALTDGDEAQDFVVGRIRSSVPPGAFARYQADLAAQQIAWATPAFPGWFRLGL